MADTIVNLTVITLCILIPLVAAGAAVECWIKVSEMMARRDAERFTKARLRHLGTNPQQMPKQPVAPLRGAL